MFWRIKKSRLLEKREGLSGGDEERSWSRELVRCNKDNECDGAGSEKSQTSSALSFRAMRPRREDVGLDKVLKVGC
jgi:hypothetical protein